MGQRASAVLAFLLAAATSAAAQSGPVGYWKGDDGNPTVGSGDTIDGGNARC